LKPIQLHNPIFQTRGVRLHVLPLYLNDPVISGNKPYKLKYNLLDAKKQDQHTILTFGGAFSNHIHATAAACKQAGFKSIGLIRGEQTLPLNSTLSFAKKCGMQIEYLDRETYRKKTSAEFIKKLHQQFGEFYLVPEGASNALGVKGCSEILNDVNSNNFNYICCPWGTGATLQGIGLSLQSNQKALGFSVLKGVSQLQPGLQNESANFQIIGDYHFGGYAKSSPELIRFTEEFEKTTTIPLDPVYTSKMFYGIYDLIQKGFFSPGTRILAIHTGGLKVFPVTF